MTLIVEIRPEVQAELARQAAAQGCAIEAYAARLLEESARVPAKWLSGDVLPNEEINLMELFEPMRGLLTDEEVDTLFSRNPSTGRPVDLA